MEAKRNLHKLFKAHHNLGSSWTTPSRLGGSPPRVTNDSHELNDVQQCSRCLISLRYAHKGFSLLPNSRDHTRSSYLTKRGWGELNELWLRTTRNNSNDIKTSSQPLWGDQGLKCPFPQKLAVATQRNLVPPVPKTSVTEIQTK